ncbi:MAG: pilus assembly protein [Planctomycetes bacterium]|nr:pilus assembly protein [Planctomycetota bacterium]
MKELDRDRESGAAMIEFVIVFPIQLTLTLLIMQFALLAHAHTVVQQAAFMGARAAAVSDGFDSAGAVPELAARRIAARTLVVLTNSDGAKAPNVPAGSADVPTDLQWSGKSAPFSAGRTNQAYTHLNVEVAHSQHLVRCLVEYDYVMTIPVANRILSRKLFTNGFLFLMSGDFNDASIQRTRPCYRIQRIGYIPTPWTENGLTGATTVALADTGNK